MYRHICLCLDVLVSTNDDILDCLVTELQILFNRNVVLDLQEDNRCGQDEGSGEDTPGGAKHGVVRGVERVETPEDGSTSGLETLVETCNGLSVKDESAKLSDGKKIRLTSQVSSLAARVGQ